MDWFLMLFTNHLLSNLILTPVHINIYKCLHIETNVYILKHI